MYNEIVEYLQSCTYDQILLNTEKKKEQYEQVIQKKGTVLVRVGQMNKAWQRLSINKQL